MDPLTALGLAGNVVTFIEFTTKLCKKTMEVYKASEDNLFDRRYSTAPSKKSSENDDWKALSGRERLEAQLGDFIITTSKVSKAAPKKHTQITFEVNETVLDTNLQHFVGYSETLSQSRGLQRPPDVSATTVESVAEASNLIARQMIDRLEYMRKTAKGKIWPSLKLAVRDLLKESEITGMQETLDRCKNELMLLVVVSLRESLALQHNRQQDQFDSLKTSMRNTLKELMEKNMAFGPKILLPSDDVARSMLEACHRSKEHQTKDNEEIMQAINEALDARGLKRLPDLSVLTQTDAVSNAAAKLSDELLDQELVLLRSLKFPAMEDREEDVSGVKVSFDWIFHNPKPCDPPWDNFSQWLSDDSDPLYWITGKAGSGKSTLMKHVYHEPRTRQALLHWANPDPLVVAAFFFWRTGSPLQKTEEGLLRSLLYQVLYTHRELIPIIFPNSKSSQDQFSADSWTIRTIRRVFQTLIRQKTASLKICFFIDGLDEYAGGHTDIADLVIGLAGVDDIKICASSRPLPDFEYSFQRRPSLMLQNLTFNDIRTYVTTKFNDNPHVAHIQETEPDLSKKLSSEIVDKASGVFLWVKLAVKSILTGLRNDDNSLELYKRLRELPTDLMELYSHMLKSVEPFYQERGTEFLQIVYRARKPFPILELAFVDVLLNEPNNASENRLGHLSKDERQEKCIRMEKRLKVACLGLLEVIPAYSDTYIGITTRPVQFMHQSVADFLETNVARRHMETAAMSHPFNPYLTLMEATLFTMKYLDTDLLPVRRPNTYLAEVWYSSAWFIIRAFMSYSAIEERMKKQAQVQLVDRMDREAAHLAKICLQLDKRSDVPPKVAAQLHWSERRREELHQVQLNGSLVSLALEFGLHFYADAKLNSGSSFKQGRKMTSKQAKFALAVEQASSSRREVPSDLRERVRNKLDSAARFRINDLRFRLSNKTLETSKIISQAVQQLDRFKDQASQDQAENMYTETEGAEIVSRTAFPDIKGASSTM